MNTTWFQYVTIFGKIDHLRASTEIHFLPIQERHVHALSRNTNCLTIDGQVCFYRRLFTDAVKPRGCISWYRGALIGLHGVSNCPSRKSWPPSGLYQFMSLTEGTALLFESELVLYPAFGSPPAPTTHPTPLPPPIDSIRDITGAEKNHLKNQQYSSS